MFIWFLKFIGYNSFTRNGEWWGRILTLLFFVIICSTFVLSLIRLILFREKILVSSIFFYLVSPVQYVLGVRYMMGTHYQSILRDIRKSLIKMPSERKIFSFIIGITILSLVSLIVIITQTEQKVPKGFDMILDTLTYTKIGVNDTVEIITDEQSVAGIYVWLFLFWIASAVSQATNLVFFAVVFHKHLIDIANLKNHLESDIIWRMNQESFIDLTRQIIGLRYAINQSVDNLENFYTSFTILGAIAIGPILESKEVTPFGIYYCIIYVLTQILFVYYIYYISKNREDILKIIKSPLVMFKYLTNVNNVNRADEILEQEIAELKKIDPLKVHTLNKYKIASYSPRNFGQDTIQMIENEGCDPIKRAPPESANSSFTTNKSDESYQIKLRPTKRSSTKIRRKKNRSQSPENLRIDMMKIRQREKEEKEARDHNKAEINSKDKIESEILTLTYKNNAAIYWMILHQVLEEKWASFNLMGMSFDDTDVIKKSMGMTSAIILVATYITSLSLI